MDCEGTELILRGSSPLFLTLLLTILIREDQVWAELCEATLMQSDFISPSHVISSCVHGYP